MEAALDRLRPEGPLGVAASGGGDSTALLLIAAAWARRRGATLEVATVDHGLRPDAADDADFVARRAGALGLACETLRWEGWDGRGNLQQAARDARSELLADWAARRGLAAVALGHTRDDQAETALLNLCRGSGVDGLAAMAERAARGGALWIRPLLGVRRGALRNWLRARGERWREDPSNVDPRFSRVRARRLLEHAAPLGLDIDRLADTAAHMARARAALEAGAQALAAAAGGMGPCGEIALARAALAAAPQEIALRLLADALRAVSGAPYRPRLAPLEALFRAVAEAAAPETRTLHGCVLRVEGETLTVAREPAAVGGLAPAPGGGALWDGRWRVTKRADGAVRPLGEPGLAALRRAAETGAWRPPPLWAAAPRPARAATPALWRGDALAAAPVAAYGAGLTVALVAKWPRLSR